MILTTVYPAWKLLEQLQVMGGHDDRRTLGTDVSQQLYNLTACVGVEVSRRLIGENNLGSVEDGTGDDDALLLATREFMGHLIPLGLHANLFQNLFDTELALALVVPSCGFEHEVEVVVYVAVNEELEILEYDADAFAQGRNLAPTDACEVIAQHFGAAAVYVQLAIHGLQEARLTRTYLTDEVYELAFLNLQVDILLHDHLLLANLYIMIVDL